MRLVKNKIELNGSGTVTLCPEEPEDMVRSACNPTKRE
jgi:protein pelota